MKKIFVCSQLRGDVLRNIGKAKEYCFSIANIGMVPLAPHVYFTTFLNDDDEQERRIGMKMALELLSVCNELWIFGTASEGMMKELIYAKEHGIPSYDGFSRLRMES